MLIFTTPDFFEAVILFKSSVKRSSSSGLLGMVAPMIMGYLGKKILKGGL